MKKLLGILVFLAAFALASCGGGGGTILNPDGGAGTGADVASVTLISSSPQLGSDVNGAATVTITALVRDSGNAVVAAEPVLFTTSSGSITVTQPTTDAVGQASATLSNGQDPTNRTITVTARAGEVTGQIVVNVVGTTLTVTGPGSLALGDTGTYNVSLRDSQGAAISGRTVDVSSSTGNSLSATNLVTNSAGAAQFTVTASASGADTLTAQALGLAATASLNVSGDVFRLLAPTAGQEILLGLPATGVQVEWTIAGVAQAGELISFASTRGTLSGTSATTDASGRASVTISATNAGSAVISATNDQGTSTTVTVEFVAFDAETVDLQASPFTVGTGQQSQLTAIVRDQNGNLVKNKTVDFVLTDTTGGFLSVGSDTTDSQGRAQTVYTGGSVPTTGLGATIQATVRDDLTQALGSVFDNVSIVVAQREVDINIGTGDELFDPTPSLYTKEWAIIVTDTTGNPVADTTVQTSIRSVRYHKGRYIATPPPPASQQGWVVSYSETDGVGAGGIGCPDEDVDLDGFLSDAEDDAALVGGFGNGNNKLDAGNRATLFGLAPGAGANACGTLPATPTSTVLDVQTNGAGVARVCVVYPQSDNGWVDVRLKALLSVFGSEFEEGQVFTLEADAEDLNDETSSPAGIFSPFGQATSCRDPN